MWVSLSNVTKRFKISPANLDLYSQNYIITCTEGKHQPWHTNITENHSRSPPPALLLKPVPSLTNSVTKPLENETLTKKESPCLQENVDIHINILWYALPKKLEFKKNRAHNLLFATQLTMFNPNINWWANCSSLNWYILDGINQFK